MHINVYATSSKTSALFIWVYVVTLGSNFENLYVYMNMYEYMHISI